MAINQVLKRADDTKSRIVEAQERLKSLMDSGELTSDKQMQAAYRYAELSVVLFKLENETEVYKQSVNADRRMV